MSDQSEHVRLAAAAVEAYVKEGRVIDVPSTVSEELRTNRAGVFVCIKSNGQLRGCIGTIEPTQECVAKEIIANAISAASKDPRFTPVDEGELPTLEYSVDVLTAPEPIDSVSELDPKVYGVIVESGARRGLLLPDSHRTHPAPRTCALFQLLSASCIRSWIAASGYRSPRPVFRLHH